MPEQSPLARLVLFMVCLAVAGSITAGAHYYAIDIPQQNALQAPENAGSSGTSCAICKNNCKVDSDYYTCLSQCELVCTD
jgi:archaellum component FlaG (FlaF/FlaG flagellin family)